ncbi:MAG: AAA family ATPase [Spirochaetaceae bacterium]|jgi:predicted AAA+ superfamily ATPase|nr:AAA family ATPase [Spirochaetaceae bacterium]
MILSGASIRTQTIVNIETAMENAEVTVLNGIRRGGKSFILRAVMDRLRAKGVQNSNIIYLDFEKFAFSSPRAVRELRQSIQQLITGDERYYLFLDEIQCATGWEKVLSAFAAQNNVVMCIAVSGMAFDKKSKKKFGGNNWNEQKVCPFSYSEYKHLYKNINEASCSVGLLRKALSIKQDSNAIFESYLERGGFPSTLDDEGGSLESKLNDIYTSIIYHDVLMRYQINNAELLERVVKYIFENLGDECSAPKLAALFKREHFTKNLSAISSILNFIEAAHLVVRVRVVNLAKQKVQSAHSKYYIGCHSLFYGVSGSTNGMRRVLCENILVNELCCRGYTVYTGRFFSFTIDFIAQSSTETLCIQTLTAEDDEKVIKRKKDALKAVHEAFETSLPVLFYFVFMDTAEMEKYNEGVIENISLPEFLLNAENEPA